jgi:hypothetical protein
MYLLKKERNEMADKSLKNKAIDIKGKSYVLVSDRIIYFNENYPNGSIQTKLVSSPEAERVVMKAKVTPDCTKPERYFTDYSQALWGEGYINKTSAIENCSTSAVGRCLAYLGIGVIDSVASVDEINKAQVTEKIQEFRPTWVKEIGDVLDGKGITDPQDKQKLVKILSGDEPLNSSAQARIKKEIIQAQSDTLKSIILEG